MSRETRYRSYRGRVFFGSSDPTNTVKSAEGSSGPRDQASIPPLPPLHVKILQHAIYSDTQHVNTQK